MERSGLELLKLFGGQVYPRASITPIFLLGLLIGIAACTDSGQDLIAPQYSSGGGKPGPTTQTTLSDPCPSCVGIFLTGDATDWNTCFLAPGGDSDGDHVDDSCEHQVALAFAPELMISPTDDAPGRETYYVVQVSDNPTLHQSLRIFYALGYHHDTGVGGPTGSWSHHGDSEFIEITVTFNETLTTGGTNGRWVLTDALLSAHYGAPNDRTNRYTANQLAYPTGVQDHPRVWVAEDNHANYPSKKSCQGLFTVEDVCAENISAGRVDVIWSRNLGSEWAPLVNCTQSVQPTVYWGIECFWNRGDTFAGWVDGAPRVTGYADILHDFFYFLGSAY